MDAQFAERRRYPRAQIEWPVVINTDHDVVKGITLNVSAGGATVRFQDPPLVHEVIELTIKIPAVDRVLVVEAQVVWSTAGIADNEHAKGTPTRVVTARRALERVLNECIEGDL